jgi:hypothetical protein
MSGTICALGGAWRQALTRDVTHLFALTPTAERYTTAMHFQSDTRMHILTPHWFDDSVVLGLSLPTEEYAWPEPAVLQRGGSEMGKARRKAEDRGSLPGKKSVFRTAGMSDPPEEGKVAERDVWKGRRILLSTSLELSTGRRKSVEAAIERAGGVVIRYEGNSGDGTAGEELELVDDADVLVARYRWGRAFIKVCSFTIEPGAACLTNSSGPSSAQAYWHTGMAVLRRADWCCLSADRPASALSDPA